MKQNKKNSEKITKRKKKKGVIQFDGNGKKSGMPGTVLAGVTTSSKRRRKTGGQMSFLFLPIPFFPFIQNSIKSKTLPAPKRFAATCAVSRLSEDFGRRWGYMIQPPSELRSQHNTKTRRDICLMEYHGLLPTYDLSDCS